MPFNNKQILSRIKQSIYLLDANADIILYGSRARKDASPDSDWDVLILIDKDTVTLEDENFYRHPLYDIELETGEIISLLLYTKKEWENKLWITPLYKNIKKEGVKL